MSYKPATKAEMIAHLENTEEVYLRLWNDYDLENDPPDERTVRSRRRRIRTNRAVLKIVKDVEGAGK